MNKVKESVGNRAKKIRKHLRKNRVAYIASGVAIAAIALQQSNRISFYKFLQSKGINPTEYYCPEAFAELSK